MHPLLARPIRLLLLVAIAALFGVPLAWVLRVLEPRPWSAALAFAVPMQVFYSFIVLSAWWVCRRHPIGGGAAGAAVGAQFGAALQATSMWVAIGAFWSVAIDHWLYPGLSRAAIFRDLGVLFVAAWMGWLASHTNIAWTWYVLIGTIICSSIGYVTSLLTKTKQTDFVTAES